MGRTWEGNPRTPNPPELPPEVRLPVGFHSGTAWHGDQGMRLTGCFFVGQSFRSETDQQLDMAGVDDHHDR